MENTQLMVTLLGAVASFLTFSIVALIGWSITRIVKSLDRAHVRIDDIEKEVRVQFVSEELCKSRRSSERCS